MAAAEGHDRLSSRDSSADAGAVRREETIAGKTMSATDFSSLSTTELARRIAILRDNIRQITEQAASQSGAADEERNADRIAHQTEELDDLLKEQERRLAAR